MTWRDRLRPASFRGVPFRVESSGASGGRRTVVHQFPGRDEPLVQDLGRGLESLTMRGYLLGDDYDLERDRLLSAARKPGPGELVHPYLGTLRVQITSFRVEERSRDGGYAVVTLGCVESGEATQSLLGGRASAQARANDAADETLSIAPDDFAEVLEPEPGAAQTFEGIVEEVEALAATLTAFTLEGPLERVAELRRLSERLADAVLSVISHPLEQAKLVRSAVTAIDEAATSRETRLDLYLELLGQVPRLRGGAAAFARRSDRNAQAVSDLYRTVALAEAVRTASEIDWTTRQDAERARAKIQAEIDRLRSTVRPTSYRALARLMAALVESVPGPDANLPELRTISPGQTVPALVLAHRLYGDRNRAAELIERNRADIPHSGRISGAAELEVLSA